jgi:hypothetical protein
MDLSTAVNTLIGAANFAQSKGAFTLKDAAIIQGAIDFFIPEVQPNSEAQPQPTVEDIAHELINEPNGK